MPAASDDELRFLRQRVDPEAVFRAHYPEVVRYLAMRLGSEEEARDVAGEVFVAALSGLPRLRWRGRPVLAWLYRVAANMAADRLTERAREPRPAPLPDRATEAATQQVVDADAVRRALGTLPADQQLVVHLRVVDDRPFADVARVMGRSVGACEMLMLRAARSLRVALREEGFRVE